MKENFIFVCLGDSLTAGSPGFSGHPTYRGNPKSQYEYWLEKMVEKDFPNLAEDIDIINFGVGGDTACHIYIRFRRDIVHIVPDADYVIVWIGINDLVGTFMAPEFVLSNIKDTYDLIMKAGAKVIAVEVAPVTLPTIYNKRVKETNRGIHALASKINALVVPLFDSLLNESGDGVHFSVAGYTKIAEVIYNSVLSKILKGEII